MANKRIKYRTKIVHLQGDYAGMTPNTSPQEALNAKIQDALNDPKMHEDGFKLDKVAHLSDFNNGHWPSRSYIMVLLVFSRSGRESDTGK